MKWLSESKAFVYMYPDVIHPENMQLHIWCTIMNIAHVWGTIISDYKKHDKFPLQGCLREAGKAYQRTKDEMAKGKKKLNDLNS